MATLRQLREEWAAQNEGVDPYAHLSDRDLADALYEKHYQQSMKRDAFDKAIGYQPGIGEKVGRILLGAGDMDPGVLPSLVESIGGPASGEQLERAAASQIFETGGGIAARAAQGIRDYQDAILSYMRPPNAQYPTVGAAVPGMMTEQLAGLADPARQAAAGTAADLLAAADVTGEGLDDPNAGILERGMIGAARSAPVTLAAVGAGVAGGPGAAAGVAGAAQYGSGYAEAERVSAAREQLGKEPLSGAQKESFAAGTALVEGLLEYGPARVALKQGTPLLRRIFQLVGVDVPSEVATTVLQQKIGERYDVNEPLTADQWATAISDTVIQTAMIAAPTAIVGGMQDTRAARREQAAREAQEADERRRDELDDLGGELGAAGFQPTPPPPPGAPGGAAAEPEPQPQPPGRGLPYGEDIDQVDAEYLKTPKARDLFNEYRQLRASIAKLTEDFRAMPEGSPEAADFYNQVILPLEQRAYQIDNDELATELMGKPLSEERRKPAPQPMKPRPDYRAQAEPAPEPEPEPEPQPEAPTEPVYEQPGRPAEPAPPPKPAFDADKLAADLLSRPGMKAAVDADHARNREELLRQAGQEQPQAPADFESAQVRIVEWKKALRGEEGSRRDLGDVQHEAFNRAVAAAKLKHPKLEPWSDRGKAILRPIERAELQKERERLTQLMPRHKAARERLKAARAGLPKPKRTISKKIELKSGGRGDVEIELVEYEGGVWALGLRHMLPTSGSSSGASLSSDLYPSREAAEAAGLKRLRTALARYAEHPEDMGSTGKPNVKPAMKLLKMIDEGKWVETIESAEGERKAFETDDTEFESHLDETHAELERALSEEPEPEPEPELEPEPAPKQQQERKAKLTPIQEYTLEVARGLASLVSSRRFVVDQLMTKARQGKPPSTGKPGTSGQPAGPGQVTFNTVTQLIDKGQLRVVKAGQSFGSSTLEVVGYEAEEPEPPPRAKPKQDKRGRRPMPNPEKHDLLEFISLSRAAGASKFGISWDEASAQGLDPEDMRDAYTFGIYRPFVRGGASFDEMAELLSEAGFDVSEVIDRQRRYSPNKLLDLLSRALAGEKIYAAGRGQERAYEQKAKDRDFEQGMQAQAELFERYQIAVDEARAWAKELEKDEAKDEYRRAKEDAEAFAKQKEFRAVISALADMYVLAERFGMKKPDPKDYGLEDFPDVAESKAVYRAGSDRFGEQAQAGMRERIGTIEATLAGSGLMIFHTQGGNYSLRTNGQWNRDSEQGRPQRELAYIPADRKSDYARRAGNLSDELWEIANEYADLYDAAILGKPPRGRARRGAFVREQKDMFGVDPAEQKKHDDKAALEKRRQEVEARLRGDPSVPADINRPGDLFSKQIDLTDLPDAEVRDANPVEGENDLILPAAPRLELSEKFKDIGHRVSVSAYGVIDGPLKVESVSDAAAIIKAVVGNKPQEQVLLIATDENKRPIAVLRHTIGIADASIAHPATALGPLFEIEGIKYVWYGHQHPSGNPTPSMADVQMTEKFNQVIEGSGIEFEGHVIIGVGSKFGTVIEPSGRETSITQPEGQPRESKIPLLERTFRLIRPASDQKMTGPSDVMAFVREHKLGSGLILFGANLSPVGFVPISAARMAKLKTGEIESGSGALLRIMHQVNAVSAIAVLPDITPSKGAMQNIAIFMQAASVALQDGITFGNRGMKSLREEEEMPRVYSSSDFQANPVRELARLYQQLLGQPLIDYWNKHVGWRYHPLKQLPQLNKFLILRYRLQGHIEKVSRDIVRDVFEIFGSVRGQPDEMAAFHYLTTRGANPNIITDKNVRVKAMAVKRLFRNLGREWVRLGVLPARSVASMADQYLPRLYLRHVLGQSAFAEYGAGRKPSKMSWRKRRSNIDQLTREIVLGQIKDPSFLAAVGLGTQLRDLHVLQFLHAISVNTDWVQSQSFVTWGGMRVTPQWLMSEADNIEEQSEYYLPADRQIALQLAARMRATARAAIARGVAIDPKLWRQLPDSPRYGHLRGAWVRKEIFDDLMGIDTILPPDASLVERVLSPSSTAGRISAWWKTTRVTLNPPTQVRNFMSNLILLHLSGVPSYRIYSGELLLRVLRDRKNDGPYYRIARKYGLFSTTFSAQELANIESEWLRIQLEMRRGGLSGSLAHARAAGEAVVKGAGNVYSMIEYLAKMAKVIDSMERLGMSEQDAILEAQKWLFDYSLIPRTLRFLRNAPIGMPFATFMYKAAPRIAEAAVMRPWTMALYTAIIPMLSAMLYGLMSGDDEPLDEQDLDDIATLTPDWAKKRGNLMFLPVKDDQGRWQLLDAGFLMPWGMFADMSTIVASDLPIGQKTNELRKAAGVGGGPILDPLVAVMTGVDPFKGTEIANKSDPPSMQAAAYASYMANVWIPPWLHGLATEGSGHVKNIKEAATGENIDYRTHEPSRTVGQATASMFGLTTVPVSLAYSPQVLLRQLAFEINEIEQRRTQAIRKADTQEERDEIVEVYRVEIERRKQRINEVNAAVERLEARRKQKDGA